MKNPRKRSRFLEPARNMPPSSNNYVEGQDYDPGASDAVKWLQTQPLLNYWLLKTLNSWGYIKFDPVTQTWEGVKLHPHEADEDCDDCEKDQMPE